MLYHQHPILSFYYIYYLTARAQYSPIKPILIIIHPIPTHRLGMDPVQGQKQGMLLRYKLLQHLCPLRIVIFHDHGREQPE